MSLYFPLVWTAPLSLLQTRVPRHTSSHLLKVKHLFEQTQTLSKQVFLFIWEAEWLSFNKTSHSLCYILLWSSSTMSLPQKIPPNSQSGSLSNSGSSLLDVYQAQDEVIELHRVTTSSASSFGSFGSFALLWKPPALLVHKSSRVKVNGVCVCVTEGIWWGEWERRRGCQYNERPSGTS